MAVFDVSSKSLSGSNCANFPWLDVLADHYEDDERKRYEEIKHRESLGRAQGLGDCLLKMTLQHHYVHWSLHLRSAFVIRFAILLRLPLPDAAFGILR